MPSIYPLSVFAAIGLGVAMAYLLLSTVCAGVLLLVRARRAATSGLRHAAGYFLAREMESIERRLRRHLTAVLLFGACFGVPAALGGTDLPALPSWGPTAIALLLAATGAFAVAKSIALVRYQSRLRKLFDASRRVAQRLEEVQRRGYHVFHAVTVGNRIVDHVIVGATGVFGAQLVVPARAGAASVSMARGALHFGPAHGAFSLQPAVESFAGLAKELGQAVGHPFRIVPMLIAACGRVESRDDDRYLLTNEQNCVTLVGWKDPAAFLMEDEITRICAWLSERCQQPRRWYWRRPRVALHACVTRPGLL